MKGSKNMSYIKITWSAKRKPMETTAIIKYRSGSVYEQHKRIPKQIASNPATCAKMG